VLNQPYFSESTVRPDGTLQLKNVPGSSYRLVVHWYGPEGKFFLKSARYGSTSVPDGGLTVQTGEGSWLDLTLSSRMARLHGNVLNADLLRAVGAGASLFLPQPIWSGTVNRASALRGKSYEQDSRFGSYGTYSGSQMFA
jgi:hypothetical protein